MNMSKFEDRCEEHCIHEEKVNEASQVLVAEEEALNLAELFKALGDPTRVKILHALSHTELCVCDLAAVVKASDSAVSHHLRLLRTHKLVRFRREGKMLFYSLDDHHVGKLMEQGLEHVRE
ncbi:MAG TPA: winged helix-turn-helix transcriptional regulator [Syntrophomonadaceae bacterium]|nr:winged helix-turn-helix transcriptional regulator [Syntrophomonadaceae bacterium]